ncbi:hypothetical protein J2X97_000688 [Epilithonimonas hungarica]|nr:hypothetical protein [Epilithonimonas hungarica]
MLSAKEQFVMLDLLQIIIEKVYLCLLMTVHKFFK